MTQRVGRLWLAGVCALMCVVVAAASLWTSAGGARTEDRNGDGRPDVWRVYDAHRVLSEVSIDTNFDGRSDVHEYYSHGSLVRRETDRDFSDRIDLVEEFDAATHEHVRSVVDSDYDGNADVLELFQRGRMVYVKRAAAAAPPAWAARTSAHTPTPTRTAHGPLASFDDPFRGDLSINSVRVLGLSGDSVGLSTSGGLPAANDDGVAPLACSATLAADNADLLASASVPPCAPRGPPAPLPSL